MAREVQDYVAQAKQEPTTENLEALWRAVFLLQGWYFLPSRSGDGPAFPTVIMVDEKPWVLVFTNVRRLKAFARAAGRVNPDGSTPMLVLDPGSATDQILAQSQQLGGAIFNPDAEDTFRAPIQALEAYAHHFGVPLKG